MKNTLFLFYFLGAFVLTSNAQAPEYNDLIVYFADGDFEKLMKVATKYTGGDDTRKDATPYLYLSKANLEISKGGDLSEKYPRAFKDAIKFAGKCLQKDKEGSVYTDNLAHFTSCKIAVFEQMRNLTESDDFGRLSGVIPLMEKIEKQEVGTAFLKAVAKFRRGDKGGYKTEEKVALEKLENFDSSTITESENDDIDIANKKKIDRQVLQFGVLQYAKLLVERGEVSKAKDVLGKVAQWFEGDEKFKKEYDKIVN